jgi:hypothetical protein
MISRSHLLLDRIATPHDVHPGLDTLAYSDAVRVDAATF